MSGQILKQRYYILTPLFLLLGVLVLVATLLLAFASYQRNVDKMVEGYEQMLTAIDATLIQDMLQRNQRQLAVLESSLDKEGIARGESAANPVWAIAHKIKRDTHYLFFYNVHSGRIDSYPERQIPPGYQPESRPWYRALAHDGEEPIWVGPYPEYTTHRPILTMIKRVMTRDGQLLGLLMVDMSFNYLRQALQRVVAGKQVAIYITSREEGRLVAGHNMELLPATVSPASQLGVSPQSASVDGRYLKVKLTDVDWDLNLYLPSQVFHDSLWETLLMVVVPALLLLTIWICSLLFLVRIFRQEQALVERSLSDIHGNDVLDLRLDRPLWFVHDSLGGIDEVRASLLLKQDALLHDPLTGIMNRLAFEQHRHAMEVAATPHWLVLFDVDTFKWVNDSWGHSVGDAVLCRVAIMLSRSLGDTLVYRIGGDEFAALLPWDRREVESRLTCLLGRVRGLKWREFKESITLSAGGAHYPDETDNLLVRADECLYQSKHQGRDCWHLAPRASEDNPCPTGSVRA